MHRLAPAALLALLWAAPAPATTFDPATTEELIRRAERVCCAQCETVEARRDPRTGLVFTHVRLRLLEDLKGRSSSGTLLLRFVGGKDGDIETIVAGMPRFAAGRESILLLGRANADGYPVLIQARRGVLSLGRDREGERYVRNGLTGLRELRGRQRLTLAEFRGAVRRIAAEQERERDARAETSR